VLKTGQVGPAGRLAALERKVVGAHTKSRFWPAESRQFVDDLLDQFSDRTDVAGLLQALVVMLVLMVAMRVWTRRQRWW